MMSEAHAVFSPISGIALQGFDELVLDSARVFRNPAASAFSQSELERESERLDIPIPNVSVPSNTAIDGAPPPPFDVDLRLLGIAKYLLEVEIETPTNELSGERVSEELKWAVLPLRILTPARVLTGLSEYCQGGCVSSGLVGGGIRETVQRRGLLAAAPMARGVPVYVTIPDTASEKIAEFAFVVNERRSVLNGQIGVPIDTFSNSFYLPSYADRGINLLITLEALLSEKGSREGIKDKVAKRAANLSDEDNAKRKQTQSLIQEAFDKRKDIEHGSKAKGTDIEEYFASHLEGLENVVRYSLFKAICLIEQGKELTEILLDLRQHPASRRR